MTSQKRAVPPEAEAAVDKYVEFHRLDPRQIGVFPSEFRIPTTMYRAGTAKWITYQSGKVDPETLRKPSRPVNYIHDHNAGVVCYLAEPYEPRDEVVPVPREILETEALTRLGYCLGFGFEDDTGKAEARSQRPLPDLYTTPNGRCLLVIQSRKHVLAMMWGGGLGVFARGIDG